MSSNNSDIHKQNEELKAQVKSLRSEVEILRKTILSGEEYYQERFYQINENVNDVVYRFRFDTHKYEYISPQVKDMFGYVADEFYKNPHLIKHIIHPDCLKQYIMHWRNIFRGKVPEYFEIKIVRRSGEVRWVQQRNLAVYDDDGAIIEIEGLVSDITERKKTEQALVESEAQKKAILNNLPHLAWMKNRMGVYLSVNESFAKRYGKTVSEVIGRNDFDLYPTDIAEQYVESDNYVINTGKQYVIEEATDGSFWETIKSPIFNNEGEIIGVTGVSLEVTERKKREEEIKDYGDKLAMQNVKLKLINDELTQAKEKAEKADRLKSAFLANMSHEIRTPMNAILGFTTLLRDRELTKEKQTQFIDLINTNSRQLLHIISDIIDISKIESDQIKMFKKDFSIHKVFNVLKQNFEEQIKLANKEIEIVLDYDQDEGLMICTDKVRLEQVLSNLMSNAVKFCDEGTITCGYRIINEGKEIELYVRDTGIGITDEEQEVIFDRFRQVSSSYNKIYGGTGLGLSISKGLIDRMGGKLLVESVVGKGSEFKLVLPYKKGAVEKPERIAYETNYQWSGYNILIAEDELANYTLLESILAPTKAKVIWVQTGVEAVKACQDNPDIHLVLMDIKMPDMNGLEATKIIRKDNKKLPILAQTAFAMPQDADNCLRAGCNDYLAKPLQIDDILTKISKYIQLSGKKVKGVATNNIASN